MYEQYIIWMLLRVGKGYFLDDFFYSYLVEFLRMRRWYNIDDWGVDSSIAAKMPWLVLHVQVKISK